MTLLDARNLHFAYGNRPVLRDVSIGLAAGEVVALLGPNGSGKSTLLRVLLGQLAAAAGSIRWNGREVRAWSRRELARAVGYLPQSPAADDEQRVAEVLRTGRAPYWGAFGIESIHDVQVVKEVAAQLNLLDLLARPMAELSGGQRQRVFLGRCLVQEPKAMLLDEPNTFLDLKHQVELGQLLRKLAHQHGVAVLMASHDLNLAGASADRLVLLHNGDTMADGPPVNVLKPELLSAVYGLPLQRLETSDPARPAIYPAIML